MEDGVAGMIRSLVWLGPAFTMAESLASSALAPAASRWQEGFLTALQVAGVNVRIVANHSERMWPRGPAMVSGSVSTFFDMPRVAVPYLNLPKLREHSLAREYCRAIDRFCVEGGAPDLVVSYNTWRPVAQACRSATRKHGIPWIPILLDHDAPTAGWANVLTGVAGSAGIVFLSHWASQNAPLPNKLHLDAGVAHVPPLPMSHPRSRMVLYSGALHQWGGIETLLDAMPFVKAAGARLVVVGRGGSSDVMKRLASTPSVEYLGAVDEATLCRLTGQAEVLANPRPAGVGGNEMNFPSKLLHYLSSLKPVATTLTPGVAPDYKDVVIAANDDSPQAFAAAVDRALCLSDEARLALSEKIQSFLGCGRLWSQQSRRFLEWADRTVQACGCEPPRACDR
jgi:glycosyltransferase involved in cell wall biosynthesis